MNAQTNWRWCQKSQGFFFAGAATPGACSGGGLHDASHSGRYAALMGDNAPRSQTGRRLCRKCQEMFHALGGTQRGCPADRQPHDGGVSRDGHDFGVAGRSH